MLVTKNFAMIWKQDFFHYCFCLIRDALIHLYFWDSSKLRQEYIGIGSNYRIIPHFIHLESHFGTIYNRVRKKITKKNIDKNIAVIETI